LPTSKDLPSSLVQLRIAVWTGVTRDTRPNCDMCRSRLLRRKIDLGTPFAGRNFLFDCLS
jgi:hypothetical protein